MLEGRRTEPGQVSRTGKVFKAGHWGLWKSTQPAQIKCVWSWTGGIHQWRLSAVEKSGWNGGGREVQVCLGEENLKLNRHNGKHQERAPVSERGFRTVFHSCFLRFQAPISNILRPRYPIRFSFTNGNLIWLQKEARPCLFPYQWLLKQLLIWAGGSSVLSPGW